MKMKMMMRLLVAFVLVLALCSVSAMLSPPHMRSYRVDVRPKQATSTAYKFIILQGGMVCIWNFLFTFYTFPLPPFFFYSYGFLHLFPHSLPPFLSLIPNFPPLPPTLPLTHSPHSLPSYPSLTPVFPLTHSCLSPHTLPAFFHSLFPHLSLSDPHLLDPFYHISTCRVFLPSITFKMSSIIPAVSPLSF